MDRLKKQLLNERKLIYKLVKEGDFTELDEFTQFVAEAIHAYASEADMPVRAYQTKESVIRVSVGGKKYRVIVKEIKDKVKPELPPSLEDKEEEETMEHEVAHDHGGDEVEVNIKKKEIIDLEDLMGEQY